MRHCPQATVESWGGDLWEWMEALGCSCTRNAAQQLRQAWGDGRVDPQVLWHRGISPKTPCLTLTPSRLKLTHQYRS